MAGLDDVAEALRHEPRILLIGQDYLRSHHGTEPLADILSESNGVSMPAWWLSDASALDERAATVLRIGNAVAPDDDIRQALEFSWNCVFTSAFDAIATRLIAVPERRAVHQITSPGFNRASGAALTLVRLFGSVDRPTTEELPPTTPAELRRRRAVAQEMLAALGEITTPNGHVFIDGWNPRSDWLRPRDLSAALAPLSRGQVLVFGLSDEAQDYLLADEDFNELVEAGVVSLHSPRLPIIIDSLKQQSIIKPEDITSTAPDTILYEVVRRVPEHLTSPSNDTGNAILPIPRLVWRQLNETFTILQELDPTEPLPALPDQQYRAFRSLLANGPSATHRWLRHLAFRRPVLDRDIIPTVLRLCREQAPQDNAIVLYGQSGSGKTVLLQVLALDLRTARLPVLLVGRGIVPPSTRALDEFCQLAETATSAPVVLIYDGLQDDVEYLNLADAMASLGRKCLIVGSSYRPATSSQPNRRSNRRRGGVSIHPIAVPVELDEKAHERDDLLAHIERFVPKAREGLSRLLQNDIDLFFALLYRLLPSTRRVIEQGIVTEIDRTADRIQRELEAERAALSYVGATNVEMALRRALGDRLDELLPTSEDALATDEYGVTYSVSDALKLLNAVMLVSRLGLQCPQSIALRLLQQTFDAYRRCVQGWHVIRESAVEGGEYVLDARHRLEAEIWIERRLPHPDDQFEMVRKLVLSIRSHEINNSESPELDFVVKLLQSIGPGGSERLHLKRYFRKIGELVAELRGVFREVHPRLLLVECHANREWVQNAQVRFLDEVEHLNYAETARHVAECVGALRDAEQAVNLADEMIREGTEVRLGAGARRALSVLETERACVLGVQQGCIKLLLDASGAEGEAPEAPSLVIRADQLLRRAMSAWREALRYEEDNFRPLDAASWIIRDRLRMGFLSADREAELLAEWSDIIDRYQEVELPPSQYEQRARRDLEFSIALGDVARFERIASKLAERGSTAAHTLKARQLANARREEARLYLESNCADVLLTDRPVLLLYCRLWWETETGYRGYFPVQRLRLAFNRQQWERLRALSEARLRVEGESENGTAMFHLAWSHLQLGASRQARDVFDQLEMIKLGGFRRARALALLTDPSGAPRRFTGDVRATLGGNRAFAWVDELHLEVPFSPIDFGHFEGPSSRLIGPFHIAMNYRGPYAEPVTRLAAQLQPSRHER